MKTLLSIAKRNLQVLFLLALFSLTSNVFAHWGSKGPYGGSVSCMVVADTLVYAGTHGGGIFRTTNQSAIAWKAFNIGLSTGKIQAIAAIGSIVFAGTNEGVFVTTDKGANWVNKVNGMANTNVISLLVNGTVIIAGTNGGGVYVSTDSSKTWIAANTGLTNLNVSSLVISGTSIFAGTIGGGVFQSNLAIMSWTAENTVLGNLNVNALAASGSSIFAGTDAGVYQTDATTISWTAENTGLPVNSVHTLMVNAGTMYAGTVSGVYNTSVGSISWVASNTGLKTNDTVNAIVTYNNKLYAGTQHSGVYKSDLSNISWALFNTAFNNLKSYAMYTNGILIVTATDQGVFVSRDLAANYVSANTNLTDSLNVTSLAFLGNDLFASTKNGGVFKSADTGRTWTTFNTGLVSLHALKIHATASKLYLATADGKLYSAFATAVSWTEETGHPAGLTFTAFANSNDIVFAGTNGNGVYTNEGGSTWSAYNHALGNMNVSSLAVANGLLFAGTRGGGVYSTSPQFVHWSTANNNLGVTDILSLAVYYDILAAGYKGGVQFTSDNGNTWHPTETLLNLPPYAEIHAIGFTTTRVFASTDNNSLYSNSLGEVPGIGAGFSSFNNNSTISIYPNPSDGHVKILMNDRFFGKDLKIEIYNVTGQLIDSNSYDDAKGIQIREKGFYIVKIMMDGNIETRSLIVE